MEDLESLIEEYKKVREEYEEKRAYFGEYEKEINEMYEIVVERVNKIEKAKETLEREGIPQEVHYFIPEGDTPFYKALSILSFEACLILDKAKALYKKVKPKTFVEKPKFDTFMKHFKSYLEVYGFELPKDKDVMYSIDSIKSVLTAERYFELISNLIKLHVEEEKEYGIDVELVWKFISESANQPDYESKLKEIEEKIRRHPDLIGKLIISDETQESNGSIEIIYNMAKKLGTLVKEEYNGSQGAVIVNNLMNDHDFRRYDEVAQRLQQPYNSPYLSGPIHCGTSFEAMFTGMAAYLVSMGIRKEEIKEIFINDFGKHWWKTFSEVYDNVVKHKLKVTEKGLNMLVGS